MLTLYYAPDTISLATHILLEEVGATYSTVRIDFKATQQRSPEYLKINPKGRMPALVIDRGILTETPAMLVFVAQSFGRPDLALIDDAFAFAQVQAINAYLCSSLHINHAHRMRGPRWVDAKDSSRDRRHAAPRAGVGRRQLRPDRARHAEGPVGDGRALHDLRSLSLHLWRSGSSRTASTPNASRR